MSKRKRSKPCRVRHRAHREKILGPMRLVITTFLKNNILYERLICRHEIVAGLETWPHIVVGNLRRRCIKCLEGKEADVSLEEMMKKYVEWIEDYERRQNGHLLGRCAEACKEMHAAFPELKIVKGHVETGVWGRRGHWWLTTPEGEIIDPTAKQFPVIFEYEPFQPGSLVRVGKCCNCGDEIWEPIQSLDQDHGQKSICSKECHDSYVAYLEGSRY